MGQFFSVCGQICGQGVPGRTKQAEIVTRMAGLKQIMEIFKAINQPLSSEQRVRWYIQRIRAAGLRDSLPPKNFLKAVCGISVVKRKITPVFTEVISYLVDSKGIEPSTSAMRTQRSPS